MAPRCNAAFGKRPYQRLSDGNYTASSVAWLRGRQMTLRVDMPSCRGHMGHVPTLTRGMSPQVDQEYDGFTASRFLEMPHPWIDSFKLRDIAQLPFGVDTCLNAMWSFPPSWAAR
ncbi:hypothetical protein R69888_06274 [Paraburkholderia haematera]|uniref:Uncharacterized protein n=1 Tax=Paraburkholderia haematera TaxID=2793077 RepID=A0ABM8SQ79_9BURK|nr:hypothetical protein R69888_06274 [Paraburkholderia haematera]